MRRVVAFALALVAASCGGRESAPETVVVLAERDVEGLDPHLAGTVHVTQEVLANAYEGLVSLDARMEIIPAVAESWTNPDERTWEFRIREGVPYHCGGTVSAGDVAFSLGRALSHPKSVLRTALLGVERIEAIPGGRVKLVTRRPDAYLLARLRDVAVVPRGPVEGQGAAAFEGRSCGTGPYRVAGRSPGLYVDLERFDGYWRGKPPVPSARFLARSFRDPDWRGLLPPRSRLCFSQMPASPQFAEALRFGQPQRSPGLSVVYLGFDLRPGSSPTVRLRGSARGNPFLDARVRRAVSLAVDRAAFRLEFAGDFGFPAAQLVPPGVFGFDPALPAPRRELEEARRLMSETPYADGFEVELDVRGLMARAGPPLARDLAAIGISARVNALDEGEFFARLASRRSSLYVLRFSCRSGDAQEVFDRWVRSKDRATGLGEANYSYDVCPVEGLDSAIDAARATIAVSERQAALQGVMRRALAADLAVPLFQYEELTFLSPGLVWPWRLDSFQLVADARLAPGTR